ncbi:MAG: carbon starvation CstA 5TM domain-containing protein, partial [candidate division WOR-3 bacterium]
LANPWAATTLAVVSAGALAFATGADGKGAFVLWPVFGALNQMLAGLALLVVTCWLRPRTRFYWLSLVPGLFMLVMTSWSLIRSILGFIPAHNWLLLGVSVVCLLLEFWMIAETVLVWTTRPACRC